jgi:large subunit ribosomal protein L1
MNKEQVKKALEELKSQPKKKFTQSYDLIINLKNLDIKQTNIDFFSTLHFPKGKQIKIAAFTDQLLHESAAKHCDLVIEENDFGKYADKKAIKKLADTYDYFISQANLMPKVAAKFGKILGIKGKMPNPKLGCVVPPNANLDVLVKKLKLTIRMSAKKALNLQCLVGKEDQPEEEIIDNIITAYTAAVKQLPSELQNVKNVTLKLTMGKPVRIL